MARNRLVFWLEEHKAFTGTDCLIWPFKKDYKGYGIVHRFRGRGTKAHRVMCIMAHGESPSDLHQAAHSCRCRDCVNPQHLRWATPSENQQDRLRDGTDARGEKSVRSKLTEEQVREIRRLATTTAQNEIARLVGVSQPAVSAVLTGNTWYWLDEGATPDIPCHLRRGDSHYMSRAVLTPEGRFASCSLAAKHHGISPAGARKRAMFGIHGWRFEEMPDAPVVTPPANDQRAVA